MFKHLKGTHGAEMMLLGVAVLWGTSYGVTKEAILLFPVAGFLFIRFLLTFVVLLPVLKKHYRSVWRPGLPLGCVLFGIFLCETWGVANTSAGNAAFLVSLCVILTPLVEWLMFRQSPDTRLLAAGILSITGLMLLTQPKTSLVGLNLGDLLILSAALLRALMVCLTRKLIQDREVSALALTAVQSGVVMTGSLILLLISFQDLPPLPHSFFFWAATVYLVLLCTIFAFFAQNYALKYTTPTRASLLMGTEPLFGALFAVVWLHESLSPEAWVGGGMIVIASLWTTLMRTNSQILAEA